MKHGLLMRQKAAVLFEAGLGYKAVSAKLEINRETVRDWSYTWRVLGTKAFCSEQEKHPVYSGSLKLAAVHDRLRGDSVIEVMVRYGIPNRHRLKEWCRAYKNKESSLRCLDG